MSDQLSLMGFDEPPRPTDRLFFALFPTEEAARRIANLALQLRGEHGLSGTPLQTERFHITLHHLGDYAGLPPDVLALAVQAAQALALPPFEISFDRVASFSGHPSKRPFVLRGSDDGLAALTAFQQTLGTVMRQVGLGRRVDVRFTPHVTLLYDSRLVAEQAVAPIHWTAHELVLVHSLLGQTRYVPLGRWTLKG
ncbi:2'-5' RNA ligase family protein [Aquabacterium sp.]|uniref:2'-5' RNA ligase family protein n=1 Tax=Aquabacterium sp. TaxID=1872578 RepID=UPI002488105C|nr:2'-5' RNA ligase family protein [Aquabacterium sp.]MDI1258920.1 2'-5' RNA ligase family protein [Aquabacterium sp.]